MSPIRLAPLLLIALLSVPLQGETAQSALRLMQDGERALSAGDFRSALYSFRQAIERNPASARAQAGAGQACLGLGQNERAREHLAQAVQLAPGDLNSRIRLAEAHIRLGELAPAEKQLMEVRKRDPSNIENNYSLGLLYRARGAATLAESFFQRTLRLSPAHAGAMTGLAMVYADRGRLGEAQRLLDRARQINPGLPAIPAAEGRLRLAEAEGSNDGAERRRLLQMAHEAFQTAARLAPEDPALQRQLADLELQLGDSEQALQRLDNSVGQSADALYAAAVVELAAGRATEAVEKLQRALGRDPGHLLAGFTLEEAALANPDFFPPQHPLRRELARRRVARAERSRALRRLDLVQAHVRRALALDPMDERALREQLEQFRRQGNYERFVQSLERLRRLRPEDAGVRGRLEAALSDRRRYLSYRSGLLARELEPERGNYSRTPRRIYVFDFTPKESFPSLPDAGLRIASAILFELGRDARAMAAPASFRSAVRALAEMQGLSSGPAGVLYRPERTSLIEEIEERSSQHVDYIVHGAYQRSGGDAIRLQVELIEKASGARVSGFALQQSGRDALTELASLCSRRIVDAIVLRAVIVRNDPGSIYLNVGSVDGAAANQQFNVMRNGRQLGRIKLVEVSAYLSRAVSVQGDAEQYENGDLSVPAPPSQN
ncbi:MAG: tetratricopeptide repeat protein [Leptospirales bacterium]|nr:tetratricopeptide repeat protein [Leptospirales bacterium]